MTITVYVGDNGSSLETDAKINDGNAFLIHNGNYLEFLGYDSMNDITVFSSLADLPKIDDDNSALYSVLQKADKIVYSPPLVWSDSNGEFNLISQRTLVEYYLVLINTEKSNVIGLPNNIGNNDYLNLSDTRDSDDEVLWVSGCSISHGVGVESDEKFGGIVAKTLRIPLVSITKAGSSIEWASDQIIRSDIRKGDIVIWGLTSEYRAPLWTHSVVNEKSVEILANETRMYKSVTSVYQVINFCNKVRVRLIILPLICSEQLRVYLNKEPHFHQLPYQTKPIDYGSDGVHPGVKQHKQWAQYCLDNIKG